MSRQVTHDGRGLLIVSFTFNQRLVDLIKSLPNRRWNGERKVWSVPETNIVAVVELLHPEGFGFDATVLRLYDEAGGQRSLAARHGGSTGSPQGGSTGSPHGGSTGSPHGGSTGSPHGGSTGAPQGSTSSLRGLFDPEPESAPEPDSAFADLGALSGPDDMPSPRTTAGTNDYSVSRLNGEVHSALKRAFPESVWLVGEISGFNKSAHKRHVGFTLVERSPSGETIAQINAILFADVRRETDDALAEAGNPFALEDEIAIRVRGRVELYEAWGQYRLCIEEIDVRYTLGEAARRREEIVRRLAAAGLLERNSNLPFPALPLRVGLITSLGSDAYNDVLKTLRESEYSFAVTVHGARVQGRATEPSVLNALDWFRSRSANFDVVLICRGGGSRTDLQWFDSEPLGRAVASFALPIVVGIGHEADMSVLDFVARRAKTPTAAAQLLVATVGEALQAIESTAAAVMDEARATLDHARREGNHRARRLVRAAQAALGLEAAELRRRRERTAVAARSRLALAKRELERTAREAQQKSDRLVALRRISLEQAVRQLAQGARRDISTARARARELTGTIPPRATRLLALASERIDARSRRLHLVDPRRVLERGYAIVRGENSRVVSDPAAAASGSALMIELRAGSLRARSEGPADEDPRSDR